MAILYCEETRQFYLRLEGLDPDATYTDSKGNTFQGKTLMHLGIPLDTRADHRAFLLVFEKNNK